jgi:uncharacterized protein (DUF849 family)
MLIKAAINGGRSKAEHLAVPVSPGEQAADVVECLEAGADAIHLHVRAAAGVESLCSDDVATTVLAVRALSPKALIGVSTGAWILPGAAARLQAVTAWEVLPDFASVNFSEDGAAELTQLLLSRGLAVEAGLSEAQAAENLLSSGLAVRCIRVLLEPQDQELQQAMETVRRMEEILESGAIGNPRVLHGTEATTWPLLAEAILRGYGVRIGFEDTLMLPDGRLARSNAELVGEVVRRRKAGA